MTINIYSGKSAYINGVPCLQSWGANPTVTTKRYSASCVPGATNTPAGVVAWNGTAKGVGWPNASIIPGQGLLTFEGVVNNDSAAGALLTLNGTAFVEQLVIEINKETGEPLSWNATYGFNGIPTEATSSATDATFNNAPPSTGLDIVIGGSSITSAGVLGIRKCTVTLKTPLTKYVEGAATKCKPGNLEADVSFDVFHSSLKHASLLENVLNDSFVVYVRVGGGGDAGDFIRLNAMRMTGKTNYLVDRDTNNIIGYTQNAQWNAIKSDNTQGTLQICSDGTDEEGNSVFAYNDTF